MTFKLKEIIVSAILFCFLFHASIKNLAIITAMVAESIIKYAAITRESTSAWRLAVAEGRCCRGSRDSARKCSSQYFKKIIESS